MHARGLVDELTTKVWPSDAFAAEALGVPADFAHTMWDSRYVVQSVAMIAPLEANYRDVSSLKVVCVNKDLIGWKPVWNRERLLQSINEEIDDFLELGMPEDSHLDPLGPQARR